MKKTVLTGLILLLIGGMLISCERRARDGEWAPSRSVEFLLAFSPGGGSDIFVRTIVDIVTRENFSNASFSVINNTAGGGNVVRMQTANTTGPMANHTLLSFVWGDILGMLANTPVRMHNLRPLAIIAGDKHLLFIPRGSQLTSFNDVVAAIERGERLSIGGVLGDDEIVSQLLLEEMGWTRGQLAFVRFSSTGEAITAAMGHHVDLVLSKPAAPTPFVESGDLIPILAFAPERFGGPLAPAPTLNELGFNNVYLLNFRSIVGPAAMTDEAAAYWVDVFRRVAETDAWRIGYLQRFMLEEITLFGDDAAAFLAERQEGILSGSLSLPD